MPRGAERVPSSFREIPEKNGGDGRSMDHHYGDVFKSGLSKELKAKARAKLEGPNIKDISRRKMDAMGLPRYEFVKMSVEEALFLSVAELLTKVNPETGKYYTNISTKEGRIFELEQSAERVIEYVREMYESGEVGLDDSVTISEYWDNTYSLNLILGENGSISVEMIHGKHSDLAYSKVAPELIVKKNQEDSFINKFYWRNKGITLKDKDFRDLSRGIVPKRFIDYFDSIEDFKKAFVWQEAIKTFSREENQSLMNAEVPEKLKDYFSSVEDLHTSFDIQVQPRKLSKESLDKIKNAEFPTELDRFFSSLEEFLTYLRLKGLEMDTFSWEALTIKFSQEDLELLSKGELPEKWLSIFGSMENFNEAFDVKKFDSLSMILSESELSHWRNLIFKILRKIPRTETPNPDPRAFEENDDYLPNQGYYEIIISGYEDDYEDHEGNIRPTIKYMIKFLDYRDVKNYGYRDNRADNKV